jgi:hypothetical protein
MKMKKLVEQALRIGPAFVLLWESGDIERQQSI